MRCMDGNQRSCVTDFDPAETLPDPVLSKRSGAFSDDAEWRSGQCFDHESTVERSAKLCMKDVRIFMPVADAYPHLY